MERLYAVLKQGKRESRIATDERLSNGHRLSVSLAANATVQVMVSETRIDLSRVVLVDNQRGEEVVADELVRAAIRQPQQPRA